MGKWVGSLFVVPLAFAVACSSSSSSGSGNACALTAGVYVLSMTDLAGLKPPPVGFGCNPATSVAINISGATATVSGAAAQMTTAINGPPISFPSTTSDCKVAYVTDDCPQTLVVQVTCDTSVVVDTSNNSMASADEFFDLFVDANGNLIPSDSSKNPAVTNSDARYTLVFGSAGSIGVCTWNLTGRRSM